MTATVVHVLPLFNHAEIAVIQVNNISKVYRLGVIGTGSLRQAIIDGAKEVAFPEFVSTLSICIVFLPIFLLSGTASYVFRPLAQGATLAVTALSETRLAVALQGLGVVLLLVAAAYLLACTFSAGRSLARARAKT